jgi:hypothetical protein
VLIAGLFSEGTTLFYFWASLPNSAFPSTLMAFAVWVHGGLIVGRAFLPPVIIAYFSAGVLPLMFERGDRNREIKSRTSANAMVLIDRLSHVETSGDKNDKGEMLRALGGQLMLGTYAEFDNQATAKGGVSSEDDVIRRDAKLLAHLARIHKLDWGAIATDVAPEMVMPPTRVVEALPAAPVETTNPFDRPPTGPGSPTSTTPAQPFLDTATAAEAPDEAKAANVTRLPRHSRPAAIAASAGRTTSKTDKGRGSNSARKARGSNPSRSRGQSLEDQARLAFAHGATSVNRMMDQTGMGRSAASSWVRALKAESAQPPLPDLPSLAPRKPSDTSEIGDLFGDSDQTERAQ